MAETVREVAQQPGQQPVRDVEERWPVEAREDLYRGGAPFALRADTISRPSDPDEEPFTRVVLEHPGAVVVLAVDDDDRVLCLFQYRHAVAGRMVELPAGLIDHEGEEPLDVARRELAEETGVAARDWTHLVSAYSSPGVSAELIHYFLARGLSPAAAEATKGFTAQHEEADMTRAWVPFADLYAAVRDGRVRDAPTVLAVLAARDRGLVGRGGAGV